MNHSENSIKISDASSLALRDENMQYSSRDSAFIIPTKDRPQKIKNLLESLANQTVSCGRVMVVDGGESIRDVVLSFSDRLPVEYYECRPPGQILQRNLGISMLDDRTPLVGSLDDDIVLEADALENMIAFWNRCGPDTAGVSFNITNLPDFRYSWIRGFFGLGAQKQGKVLRSGFNETLYPAETDLKTEWLCGGAVVWRREILENFRHKSIPSRWAVCEDLIFSYPVGKRFALFVCADAKVRHEHEFDHRIEKKKYQYYGKNMALWRLYFIRSNPEFSQLLFLWMMFGHILTDLIKGLCTFQTDKIHIAMGKSKGLAKGIMAQARGMDISSLLEDDSV